MHTNTVSEKSGKRKDIINCSILLAIALCVGVYLISTTVIIARDGVTFIEYSKSFATAPVKTMLSQHQHPGYPLLILAAHQAAGLIHKSSSVWSWVYPAQIVTLIFRLLTIITLYFTGKEIAGRRFSFIAILILILLPNPAEYGSDALSDWPHLFFLSAGFLLLLRGAINKKWWLFGIAGLFSGLGYLIRPECVQLVILGSLWIALQLFWTKRSISQRKAVFALALLFAGFLVSAGPYMKLKKAAFPKKDVGQFGLNIEQGENYGQNQSRIHPNIIYVASFSPPDIAKALGELIEEIGDTLMWFFGPAFLIGVYKYFRRNKWHEPKVFFIATLIALNIPLLIWLYGRYSYISGRHILPLLIFTIFCLPVGLQVFADCLSGFTVKLRLCKKQYPQIWFFILTATGMVICLPKLFTSTRADKQSYLVAAQWLAEYTDEKAIVAVPDTRISFYAQRQGLLWRDGKIPEQAQYIVSILKKGIDETILPEHLGTIEYKYTGTKNDKTSVTIYRKI